MDKQQELGGAQALLELGSKFKDENGEEINGQLENHEGVTSTQERDQSHSDQEQPDPSDQEHEHEQQEQHQEHDATNQQINDAVEAAVMKYVGGNLEEDTPRKKRKMNHDEIISNLGDFQNWNFLDEDIKKPNQNNQNNLQSHTQNNNNNSNNNTTNNNGLNQEIDPELSNLSENDPMVRAALIEAREFAKNLGAPYTSSQIQQAISSIHHQHSNPNQTFQQLHANELSNLKQKHEPSLNSNNIDSSNSNPNTDNNDESPINYNHIHTIEQLTDESQKIAMDWYKTVPEAKGPRSFSNEELRAIEYFINGYQYLFRMSRKDVCNRIWTPERKKDNFWEFLTKVVPYRSRASTYKHVRRQYHPFDIRGKWTTDDDDKLRQLSLTKLSNWKEIGSIMGRMPEDCRDRWRNYIKCGDNRMENKWTTDEEIKLKNVVTEMLDKLKGNSINWTLVSEAMNGSRSRIQCRYKWNKLVKRESINRASFMDDNTKLWLYETLKKLNFKTVNDIDWNLIVKFYNEDFKLLENNHSATDWLPNDFQYGFDKFKMIVKDYKRLPLSDVLDKLINEILTRQQRSKEVDQNDHNNRDYLWR